MQMQDRIATIIMKERKNEGEFKPSDCKIYHNVTTQKTTWYWDMRTDQQNLMENLKIDPNLWSTDFQ